MRMLIAICCARSIERSMASTVLPCGMAGWRGRGSAAELAAAVRGRSDAMLGQIDLVDFVAAAIGRESCDRGVLRLPTDWCAGLDELPGFDRAQRAARYADAPVARRTGPVAGVSRPGASSGAGAHLPRAAMGAGCDNR